MSGKLLGKNFKTDDGPQYFGISELLRSRIEFQRHDLLSLKTIGEGFGLILCNNMLLHLQHAEPFQVIGMFHGSLAPGGFFATEQTGKKPGEIAHPFEQVVSNAQLFKRLEVQRRA